MGRDNWIQRTNLTDFKIDLPYTSIKVTGKIHQWCEPNGARHTDNQHGFRTADFATKDHTQPMVLTFGDSHTWGAGNHDEDIWPELLKDKIHTKQIFNLAQAGVSSDYIVRIMPQCLEYFKPDYVFVLWADHSRFEYEFDNGYKQCLPTSSNRIYFMEQATDEWLMENFNKQVSTAETLCRERNIPLFGMTLYDLIPIIDHADCWPRALNGTHYNRDWHNVVADLFTEKFYNAKA